MVQIDASCLNCSPAFVTEELLITRIANLQQVLSDGFQTFVCNDAQQLTFNTAAEISANQALLANHFLCSGDPPEAPCSSLTAPFVAQDPTCVALIDDVAAAVIGQLGDLTGSTGPIGPTGIQGFAGPIGPIGPIGFVGPQGIPGVFPTSGSTFADLIRNLAITVQRIFGSEQRSGSSLPASPATVQPTTSLQRIVLEKVGPGGSIAQPVIKGSTSDPTGILRPRFPQAATRVVPRRIPPTAPPRTPLPQTASERALFLLRGFMQFGLPALLRERERDFQRDQIRRARDIANINKESVGALSAFLQRVRGTAMPFGQAGFTTGQDSGLFGLSPVGGGGFFDSLPGIIEAITGGRGVFPQTQTTQFAGAAAKVAKQLPGILGGLAGGELLEGLFGNGGNGGALFKPSASRIVAVPEITMMGPDGKCHTWLHATPKGWKINKSNVTGRRRRHHHHRPR